MIGEKTITVSRNIARVFEIFHVDPSGYRIIDEKACEPFVLSDVSVLKLNIVVESIVKPSITGQLTDEQTASRDKANAAMRRFRTMSVFSGAGGMDIGLAETGAFRTEWAIDTCPNSAATFAGHHPKTRFLTMDAGKALEKRHLLGMPQLGEVDVMLLGPPCQAFSTLNRQYHKGRHDSRSLLIATGLSYVDVYRPMFGCIENVCGMLIHGDCGKVKGKGTIKFIGACLSAMGYKFRFCKVQCGYYGIPQSRTRVKILFAQRHVSLPSAPVPTTRMAQHSATKGGPGPAVTISDATSDLPRWEYSNPHLVYSPERTLNDTRKLTARPKQLVCKDARNEIGLDMCTYASMPQNDFQRLVRPGTHVERGALVQQHVTSVPHSTHVERMHNIPFRAGANHLDLYNDGHHRLQIVKTKELQVNAAFQHAYERLSAQGAFQIVTTQLTLESKLGRLLMPDQQRIPTVRELARAQGFPDAITFRGTVVQCVRQVGNAVPVPLARAVGLAIRQAAIDDYLTGYRHFHRRRRL